MGEKQKIIELKINKRIYVSVQFPKKVRELFEAEMYKETKETRLLLDEEEVTIVRHKFSGLLSRFYPAGENEIYFTLLLTPENAQALKEGKEVVIEFANYSLAKKFVEQILRYIQYAKEAKNIEVYYTYEKESEKKTE